MPVDKNSRRKKIHLRVRKSVNGTDLKPRLCVFRSNKEIYAQLVNDLTHQTLASASTAEKNFEGSGKTKIEQSELVGQLIAERAQSAGITEVKFDRGGYLYHGRVKALAEGARKAGLKF